MRVVSLRCCGLQATLPALALLACLVGGRPAGAADPPPQAPADKPRVTIGLLVPRGLGADPRPRALVSLQAAVARRTAVEVTSSPAPRIAPADPKLFEHPLVVLSGAGDFEPFNEREIDLLRSYLSLGGMVIVDDASPDGDTAFQGRARSELGRALGGREPVVLPEEHAIFRSYYLLDRAYGRVDRSPRLEALVLGGRAAVVFSANDLLGALARDEFGHPAFDVKPGGSRQREMALRLGVNLVVYALTLDYKEDLVHLPLILERRR